MLVSGEPMLVVMQQREGTHQAVYLDLLCKGCSRGESILIHSSWRSFHPWKWTKTSLPSWSTSTILASHHLSPRWSLASNRLPCEVSQFTLLLISSHEKKSRSFTSLNSSPWCFLMLTSLDPDSWSMSRTSRVLRDWVREPQHVVSPHALSLRTFPLAGILPRIMYLVTNCRIFVSQMLVFDIRKLTQKSHFIRISGRHLALH